MNGDIGTKEAERETAVRNGQLEVPVFTPAWPHSPGVPGEATNGRIVAPIRVLEQPAPAPAPSPADELTPSELIVLGAIEWEDKELEGVVRPQVKNPPNGVARLALAVALLAREGAGQLRLEEVQKKVFFGWFNKTELHAVRGSTNVLWPAGSLEGALGTWTSSVSDMIYSWAGPDSYHAWTQARDYVMSSLVDRRVLDRVVVHKTLLGLLTTVSTHYVLPERHYDIDIESAERLLEECRETRPTILQRLMEEIRSGINRHQLHDYD